MDKSQENIVKKLQPLLREVLSLLGENPDREGVVETPKRWAEALVTYTSGINQDPHSLLETCFHIEETLTFPRYEDMIVMNNIEFVSMCEHHMAPIRGIVHVGYIPNIDDQKMVGLSKIVRVVNLFARRLQMQERFTQDIADAIDKCLQAQGVIVMTQAIHFCMIQRGVEQHASSTLTTARRGLFLEHPELETKFQGYLGGMRHIDDTWQH